MRRFTEIITITSLDQLPTVDSILKLSREQILKIIFEGVVQNQRKAVGQNLIKELHGFQVGIHLKEPEINIAKLITDNEIEDNQTFFEQCAKDYRQLGEELLFKLVDKLDLKLNKDFPMETFNELKRDKRQIGKVEDWRYFVHGFHCGFENFKTGQLIEVPLVFGQEFGDLNPYFFSKFIKSTPKYRPLPIDIFEDYADGERINEKMISLGKFERISSNVGNHYGIIVTDRQKVEIKSYLELEKNYQKQNGQIETIEQIEKPKFNFWKFIGLTK